MAFNPGVATLCPRTRSARILGLAVLALAASGPGCGGGSAQSAQASGPGGIPVKLEVARSVPIRDTTEYVATLKSRDSAVIMPEVEGRIIAIYVHSGERLAPGTPLMQIDPSKQEATVNSQEHSKAAQLANLKWLQEQYQRTSARHAAGVVSQQDLDQSKSALENAEAQLHSLDAQVQEQQVQLH